MSHSESQPRVPDLPGLPEFIALTACLMALTAFSVDIMLPALPRIREDYGLADVNAQQLVVSAYVGGFALGQLFIGPISDRYGRRPVLLIGLAAYAVAAFACLVADSFSGLLLARFVQGLANASPRVIAIAMTRDSFHGRRMAEVMSFVMMVFIIVPVIAPTLGGLFLLAGSWHLIFAFLCLFAIGILAWCALRLPETHPAAQRAPMSLGWLGEAIRETATHRQTLGYTLATGVIFGALMGYINSAQQVFQGIYDVGALFPVLFGACAIALAIAAFVSGRFVMRVGSRKLGHAAVLGFAALSTLHYGLFLAIGTPPLPVFLVILSGCLFCFGLVMPNYNALAMEPMGRIAGTASSFVGAVTTGLAAVLGLVIGQRFDGTVGPLLAGFAFFGVASVAITLVTERGRLFGAGQPRMA
ncbi:multidrug effflux MFS transporter [Amaricoccus solimangrovi]|uniref:Bcr/CflA family efflux transporter n=1 Tax=Amaricoccus solimangrovi TaxID=2589815 RepID=A0A501WPX0_9RHOB|nr:multidrug effflux MFS transporter [Amaricoccus solimangrovi]TPE51388.1 multidrug effflux MFS transporter [Amaricoccus solimangrovi]